MKWLFLGRNRFSFSLLWKLKDREEGFLPSTTVQSQKMQSSRVFKHKTRFGRRTITKCNNVQCVCKYNYIIHFFFFFAQKGKEFKCSLACVISLTWGWWSILKDKKYGGLNWYSFNSVFTWVQGEQNLETREVVFGQVASTSEKSCNNYRHKLLWLLKEREKKNTMLLIANGLVSL